MLELGRLAERVDQGLPVLEAARVRITRSPPDLQDVGQRTMRAGRDVLEHRMRCTSSAGASIGVTSDR